MCQFSITVWKAWDAVARAFNGRETVNRILSASGSRHGHGQLITA
jgi:hypothetical protein